MNVETFVKSLRVRAEKRRNDGTSLAAYDAIGIALEEVAAAAQEAGANPHSEEEAIA